MPITTRTQLSVAPAIRGNLAVLHLKNECQQKRWQKWKSYIGCVPSPLTLGTQFWHLWFLTWMVSPRKPPGPLAHVALFHDHLVSPKHFHPHTWKNSLPWYSPWLQPSCVCSSRLLRAADSSNVTSLLYYCNFIYWCSYRFFRLFICLPLYVSAHCLSLHTRMETTQDQALSVHWSTTHIHNRAGHNLKQNKYFYKQKCILTLTWRFVLFVDLLSNDSYKDTTKLIRCVLSASSLGSLGLDYLNITLNEEKKPEHLSLCVFNPKFYTVIFIWLSYHEWSQTTLGGLGRYPCSHLKDKKVMVQRSWTFAQGHTAI